MTLIETRESLHAVAEQVLAPALRAATGHIGLQATPGGFGTPPYVDDRGDRQLLVRGTLLVDRHGPEQREEPVTTIRAAAAFVRVEPGPPDDLYPPATTTVDLDAPLVIDAPATQLIADWFALGREALHQLVALDASTDPPAIQLWPEHFDLAMTIGRVNFGASPGDADHPDPYLYVGPFDSQSGPFWNEPFGASMARSQVADVAGAVDFFSTGLDLSR